jgi:proline utilization trans-activator
VDNAYELQPDCTVNRQRFVADLEWPSEEQAHCLLDTVVCSIGSIQHLVDPRAFSDSLSSFYDEDLVTNPVVDLKHVEMLMVFALGHLLQGKPQRLSSLPGEGYFLNALSQLPSLCTLRKAGTLAIEIMGLFAFFLQCSDQKDDAYIYVGSPIDYLSTHILGLT